MVSTPKGAYDWKEICNNHSTTTMLELKKVTKKYGDRVIFKDLSITFDQKDLSYCILGNSGVGKTTLFQILFGLDFDYEGEYLIDGKDSKKLSASKWNEIRSSQLQIVYQDYKLLEHLNVLDNIRFACVEDKDEQYLLDLLSEMDLLDLKAQKVSKLSGGEKQRLALVRAICNSPEVILLDEPTGSLDDTNAALVMDYITKLKQKGITLIIITHDARALSYCDRIYKIENHHLVLDNDMSIKDRVEAESKTINTISSKPHARRKNIRYSFASLRSAWKDSVLSNVPILILLTLFIFAFSLVQQTNANEVSNYFHGMGKNAIRVNTSTYTDVYGETIDNSYRNMMGDGTRLFFSKQDLENVQQIDGVEKATLVSVFAGSTTDLEKNTLNETYSKNDLSEDIKSLPMFSQAPSVIELMFSNISVPQEFIDAYNPINFNVIHGDFPVNNKNEILISDVYASTLLKSENVSTVEEIVGRNISLNVKNEEEKELKKDYIVRGIYASNYQLGMGGSDSIYTSVQVDELPADMTYEEMYLSALAQYQAEPDFVDAKGTILESEATYEKAYGTGKGDLIIVLQMGADEKFVNDNVQELFPNLQVISQYSLKYGTYKSIYNRLMFRSYMIMSGIAIVFGLLIVFLNKGFIKRRNKEMALLYSLGYSKAQIYKIVVYDYILSSSITYIVAIIVIYIVDALFISNNPNMEMLSQATSFSVLGICYLYMLAMMLVSVLFSIYGVNRKKLLKYLR